MAVPRFTKGLQESIHRSRKIDHEIKLQPILDQLAPRDRVRDEETESKYSEIIGGPGLALAQAFKIVHPDLKNSQTHHWDQIRAIFDLLL
ncbi:DUF1931 family protein [Streptomyces maoxianensis]|uniref:DUF1931 family protein n=1 Tax=Streptomyces maoxianensis TaxID=1459942 RepID=A0ABV9GB01_9ACTN